MTSDCSCGRQARFANAPIKIAICWAFAATLTACDAGPSAQPDPQKLAAALTGEDKLAADKSPQCKLFKPAELAKFVGLPVGPGRVAAMGSGCQWLADGNDDGSVLIQVVAARYHEAHSGAPEFKKLPDIGHRGFVEHDMGWNAGAIVGSESVVVSVTGPAANASTAIALLKETIARKAK